MANRPQNSLLLETMKKARTRMVQLTPAQKKALEQSWDIEHAYYSSALEGSRLDRQEFEKLGKELA